MASGISTVTCICSAYQIGLARQGPSTFSNPQERNRPPASPRPSSGASAPALPMNRSYADDVTRLSEEDLATLRPLAREVPNIDFAVAEIGRFSAELTLPKGTIHVISDIHGEDKKLRHVINNASGTLRPLVEKLFAGRMQPKEFQEFLTLIFYPAEVAERLEQTLTEPGELRAYAVRTLRHEFELVRTLSTRYSLRRATESFPAEYGALLEELLNVPTTVRA